MRDRTVTPAIVWCVALAQVLVGLSSILEADTYPRQPGIEG
jgi:hypothetical protein